jgi:hypothetical protein
MNPQIVTLTEGAELLVSHLERCRRRVASRSHSRPVGTVRALGHVPVAAAYGAFSPVALFLPHGIRLRTGSRKDPETADSAPDGQGTDASRSVWLDANRGSINLHRRCACQITKWKPFLIGPRTEQRPQVRRRLLMPDDRDPPGHWFRRGLQHAEP